MAPARARPERHRRSDAIANRERLLVAAALAVNAKGEKVPMSEIAESASVGVGTLYRHFPTRERLLGALSQRSFNLALIHARTAAADKGPAIESIGKFFELTIKRREELILPLHGGPVILDEETRALQGQIRVALEEVLARGRRDGTIRAQVTAEDIIITGALLAQPLPHVPNWDRVAGRLARLYLVGVRAEGSPPSPRTPSSA